MVYYSLPRQETWAQRRYAPAPAPGRPPGRPLMIILGAALSAWAGAHLAQLMPTPSLSQRTEPRSMPHPPQPTAGLSIVLTGEPGAGTAPPTSTEERATTLTLAMTEQAPLAPPVANAVKAVSAGFHPSLAPSPACKAAATLAAEMACVDPMLALAEQRLSRAYIDAIDAGAARLELGHDQARWLLVREAAARASPEALAEVYQLREQRLIALAAALSGPSVSAGSGAQRAAAFARL